MEGILALVDNSARFVAILGGALAAVFVAYTGILWMMSAGDPQKVAQARGALIGVLVGLILVGMAFLVPRIISETIIEPAGGARVGSMDRAGGCDTHLRRHLVATKAAGNALRMEEVIDAVQARYSDCPQEFWDPDVLDVGDGESGQASEDCAGKHGSQGEVVMGGIPVPVRLVQAVGSEWKVYDRSMRDPYNNILVLWNPNNPPSDSATCWVYYSRFGSWQIGYD